MRSTTRYQLVRVPILAGLTALLLATSHVTAVMHGFCCLYIERKGSADVVQHLENLLVFLSAQVISLECPARDHQKKQAPHFPANRSHKVCYSWQLGKIAPCDGGLDLGFQADLLRLTKGEHGTLKRPGHSTEIVVRTRFSTVQTDRHSRDAETLKLIDRLRCQQRGRTRADIGS